MTKKALTIGSQDNQSAWVPGFTGGGIYPVFFLLTIALIILALVKYYGGYDNVLDWILVTNTSPSPVSFDDFNIGLFRFEIPADNYLVWQAFMPTDIAVDYRYFFGFLVALGIGLSAFQAAYSRMSRYPFVLCSLLFIVLYHQMHLEEVVLFGQKGRLYVFVLVGVHLATAFAFHAWLKTASSSMRFLAFLVIHAISAWVIHEFATLPNPFLIIVPYAFLAGVILSLAFVVIVSQEVIFGILLLTTRSVIAGKSNGKHFLILGGIYLVNLLLLAMRNAYIIPTDLAIINEVWILIISTVIAFFTIHHKQVLFPSYPFSPFGHLLVGGLAIVCFSLLTFQFANVNTPAIDAFENLISYIHLGFGFMFYAYVILNFLGALYHSVPVYKIVYKELNFPYVTSLLGGLAFFAGFFFYTDKIAYYQVLSGHYNLHGDVQQVMGNYELAESYYKGGGFYGGSNHKSYYHLATLAKYENRDEDTEYFLSKAVRYKPSEHAYIMMADFYKQQNDFFKGIFTLQEGLRKFPESEFLRNNLAMQYARTNILDSALYYFDAGYYADEWADVSNTNNWYIFAKSNLEFSADTVNQLVAEAGVPLINNLLAYGNLKDQQLNLRNVAISSDSVLNSYTFPLLNNLTLNLGEVDTETIEKAFKKASANYKNGDLADAITYNRALLKYRQFDYNGFFRAMDAAQVGADDEQKGKYFNTIGLVALKLNAPRLAVNYFGSALQYQYDEAKVNYGLALNEAHLLDDAKKYWQTLMDNPADTVHRQVAFNQTKILAMDVSDATAAGSDPVLYQFLRVYMHQLKVPDFLSVFDELENPNMQGDLLMALCEDRIAEGRVDELSVLLQELDAIAMPNLQLQQRKSALLLTYAMIRSDQQALAQYQQGADARLKDQWPVLQVLDSGQDSATLANSYQMLGLKNPFHLPSVMMSAAYFEAEGLGDTSYEILLNAIEINPYSLPLLKAYAMTALRQQLPDFASDVLPRIENLSKPAEYRAFLSEFETLRGQQASADLWE